MKVIRGSGTIAMSARQLFEAHTVIEVAFAEGHPRGKVALRACVEEMLDADARRGRVLVRESMRDMLSAT